MLIAVIGVVILTVFVVLLIVSYTQPYTLPKKYHELPKPQHPAPEMPPCRDPLPSWEVGYQYWYPSEYTSTTVTTIRKRCGKRTQYIPRYMRSK